MTVIPASASVRYVDDSASGGGDGTSWATAYNDLQTALTAATAGDRIWAAAGTYKPAGPGGPPTATFQLKNGVAIYGGFAGNETQLDQRDPAINITILSGDLNGDDTGSLYNASHNENSYHVVTGSGTDATAVLDGFTISDGNAPYDTPEQYGYGGGMYNEFGNPTLANCTFEDNAAIYGGGIYNYFGNPTLTNCAFSMNHYPGIGNLPDLYGGGMYNDSGNPTLTNCTFSGNLSDIGGGMYNDSGNPILTNCTFSDNSADSGVGMYNYSGNPTLTNCTFSENQGTGSGVGMYNDSGNPTLTHCTFSGNSAYSSGGGMLNYSGSPILTHCTFSGNGSGGNGGGMSNYSGSPTLIHCTFIENGTSNGGGMYNSSGSGGSASLTNCSFIGNAADYGGGINGGNLTLTNCTFSTNGATEGGGIRSGGNLILTNCTFSGNFANWGGGIGVFGVVKLTNVILWGNIDGYGPSSQISDGANVTYSNIQGGYPGIGNIDADPLFVRNPISGFSSDEYGDLRLRTSSPCIDAGNNSEVPVGVTTDLADNPRFADDPNQTDCPTAPGTCGTAPIVDMGAYEGAVPTIVVWKSARLHGPNGPNGEVSITLNPTASGNGSSGPTVETRNGGILKIEVAFDQPVSLVDSLAVIVMGQTTVSGTLQGPVDYSGSATVSMSDVQTMAILFEPAALPDETCYTISIAGAVENGAGLALGGDTDCNIRSLIADVNGSGTVSVSDQLSVRSKVNTAVEDSPKHDLNLSGTITVSDQLLARSRVTSPTKTALCP